MIAWNKGNMLDRKKYLNLNKFGVFEFGYKFKKLALFNLSIDSKLRSCDLISLNIRDISATSLIQSRTMIEQQKNHKEVQFEITLRTQQYLSQSIYIKSLTSSDFLFPIHRKLEQHIKEQTL